MADELNTIRTTELQKLDTSQVVDILVNSADDAGRIALTDFLASITTNSDWYSITSKPFTDLDIEYFTTKVSEEGFPVLSFNEDISADLHKLSEISDITNGLSTRIVALEADSHTHENKEIIDLFSITEDNDLERISLNRAVETSLSAMLKFSKVSPTCLLMRGRNIEKAIIILKNSTPRGKKKYLRFTK